MKNRNRDTDVENKHMDIKKGKRVGGMKQEIGIDRYTLSILYIK